MNGLDFVRRLLDSRYAYLIAYENCSDEISNSLVGNMLLDLKLKWVVGLSVHTCFMNPEGIIRFSCDVDCMDEFLPYYCISTDDRRIPEIERTVDGIPIIYETFEDANDVLKNYSNYFTNEHLEIIAYTP